MLICVALEKLDPLLPKYDETMFLNGRANLILHAAQNSSQIKSSFTYHDNRADHLDMGDHICLFFLTTPLRAKSL